MFLELRLQSLVVQLQPFHGSAESLFRLPDSFRVTDTSCDE